VKNGRDMALNERHFKKRYFPIDFARAFSQMHQPIRERIKNTNKSQIWGPKEIQLNSCVQLLIKFHFWTYLACWQTVTNPARGLSLSLLWRVFFPKGFSGTMLCSNGTKLWYLADYVLIQIFTNFSSIQSSSFGEKLFFSGAARKTHLIASKSQHVMSSNITLKNLTWLLKKFMAPSILKLEKSLKQHF